MGQLEDLEKSLELMWVSLQHIRPCHYLLVSESSSTPCGVLGRSS